MKRHSGAWIKLVATRRLDGTAYILAIGEIDSNTQDELGAALRTAIAAHERVDLDIGMVTFIDAATVGTLVQYRNLATAYGCAFRVLHPTGMVARVLDITHTKTMLCGPDGPGPDRLPQTVAGVPQRDP